MVLPLLPLRGAEFVFINGDSPGEGLNDTTPAAPVGGNTATTVGAQRLAAVVRAGEIWGSFLVSNVPIRVAVDFNPLGSSTLAAAGPEDIEENFPNAPRSEIWYPVALANSLAGVDLEPARPDISVTASSNANFYYGFDSATPPGQSNFVDVLLHELGHGLGFISFADLSNGSFPLGQPDIFSTYVYDHVRKAAWPQLTAAQRVQSAASDPNLIWTGPFTTAGAPYVLDVAPAPWGFSLTADLPGGGMRDIAFEKAAFGGAIPAAGFAGQLVVTQDGTTPPGDPTGACQTIQNGAQVAGNIAFIRRGLCNFDDKVYRAQVAGAVAVIIADNVDGNLITPSGDGVVDGVPRDITIPALFVSKADGDALSAASPGVVVRVEPLPPQFAGTTAGRLRLHAPAAVSGGSSVSHWTPAASPNLLMEPFINPVLDRILDLTLTEMKDIGWRVVDIPFPHLTYDSWVGTEFPRGSSATQAGDDPDGDGVSNFEEYFFGSDPLAGGMQRLPVFMLRDGRRELEFTRSRLPTDVSYIFEKSTDLLTFTRAEPGVDYEIISATAVGTAAEKIVIRMLAGPPRLFLRLRIASVD